MSLGQTVRVSPEDNPNAPGGPTRRSPHQIVPSGAGMPPAGYPQTVYPSPHTMVPDSGPPQHRPQTQLPGLYKKKFLPDGRVVLAGPVMSLNMARAVTAIAVGAFTGTIIGTAASTSGNRKRGALYGAGAGVALHLLGTLIVIATDYPTV